MTISSTLRAESAPDVLIREIGGEAVLLDLKTERYLGLNETGTRMWQLLMESASIESACAALLSEYEVDPDGLRQDFSDFIDKLTANGLIALLPTLRP
jgi:hypothetical protein